LINVKSFHSCLPALKNMYQKLNVNSRKQAVERAKNLGILNNA